MIWAHGHLLQPDHNVRTPQWKCTVTWHVASYSSYINFFGFNVNCAQWLTAVKWKSFSIAHENQQKTKWFCRLNSDGNQRNDRKWADIELPESAFWSHKQKWPRNMIVVWGRTYRLPEYITFMRHDNNVCLLLFLSDRARRIKIKEHTTNNRWTEWKQRKREAEI